MGSHYYHPGATRAARVEDLFGAVARRYDLMNDLQSFGLHRAWKRRLVRLAQPRGGERGLDLCCGTGDVAFGLADAGVHAVGLDFSAPMLGVAEQRAARRRCRGQAQFVRGDALRLPFPAGSFDIVTISYGLRNLADWNLGLTEMWRVTRSGGRVLVLDFAIPESVLWRSAYLAYLRFLVPALGWMCCGDAHAYSYILESLRHYPGREVIRARFTALKADQIQVVGLLGGVMTIHRARKGAGGQ